MFGALIKFPSANDNILSFSCCCFFLLKLKVVYKMYCVTVELNNFTVFTIVGCFHIRSSRPEVRFSRVCKSLARCSSTKKVNVKPALQ